jgi:hypothetical protein
MNKTQYITDLGTYYNMLTDPSKEITNWHIMSENIMLMEYKINDNFDLEVNAGNVVIAAMCTSWARLKLWGSMKHLGSRVLYHDTDSVIFSAKEGEDKVQLGPFLGDFTNELTCKELNCKGCEEGHWIVEFIGCGPKNYAYRLNSGEVVCKVRGFSLNYQNSQKLNFHTMKEALFEWHNGEKDDTEKYVTVSTMISRNKYTPCVYNRQVKKCYGVVYDKRKVQKDLTTVPFGYMTS